MPGRWPWEVDTDDRKVPAKPNRAQRRAMEQQAKRNQRRGQRAFDRAQRQEGFLMQSQKSTNRAEEE